MPHLVLDGEVDFERLVELTPRDAIRWGVAVLKVEEVWRRSDGRAVLLQGVVVEHSRPLHPVAVVTHQRGQTSVRLWPLAPVERTPAVQRWLAVIARAARDAGCSALATTNVLEQVLEGLELSP
jgi:hypothetical protein